MSFMPSMRRRFRRRDAGLNRDQQCDDLLHMRAQCRPVGIVEIETGVSAQKIGLRQFLHDRADFREHIGLPELEFAGEFAEVVRFLERPADTDKFGLQYFLKHLRELAKTHRVAQFAFRQDTNSFEIGGGDPKPVGGII